MIHEDKINRLNGRLKDIELETDELEQQRKDVEVNYYVFIENWQILPSCYANIRSRSTKFGSHARKKLCEPSYYDLFW